MSFIKNLIKESETKPNKKSKGKEGSGNDSDEEKKTRPIIKSALDLQRLKLEKLMKNPDKPVIIPEHRREKDFMQSVPTFVRNVMGSSAGAGSGEFHVYRHLRRKEYARQKMIQSKSHQEQLDDDYQQKLEDNRRIAEDKTAKKRAKRLKKKQRAKKPRQQKSSSEICKDNEHDDTSSSDEDQKTDIAEINDKEQLEVDDTCAKSNETQTNQIVKIIETIVENKHLESGQKSEEKPTSDDTQETEKEEREIKTVENATKDVIENK